MRSLLLQLQYCSDLFSVAGVHIVIQMGLTALSLVCSVFVLRLVHTDYKDVPEVLRKVSKSWSCPHMISGENTDEFWILFIS